MSEEATVEGEKVETETTQEFQPMPLNDLFVEKPSDTADTVPDKASVEEVKEETTEEPKESEISTESTEPEPEVKPNWEEEVGKLKTDNERLQKQYRDTQTWGNKAHQKLKELGVEDMPEPSEEKRMADFAFMEREKASLSAAKQIHGDDVIAKYNDALPLIVNDPIIFNRVYFSETPVLEALKIVKEQEFFGKYGNDVEKIPTKIKQELETELREKITKELQSKLSKKEQLPNTAREVKSREIKVEDRPFTPIPARELFG